MMRRLTLLLAMATIPLAASAFADREVTHPFDSTTPLQGVLRIVIDIPAGEFRIRNSAGNTLGLHGAVRREYDGYNRREQNQSIVDDINPEVIIKGDEAIVRRRFGPNAKGWSARNHSNFDVTI